jgi:hypothetical protein
MAQKEERAMPFFKKNHVMKISSPYNVVGATTPYNVVRSNHYQMRRGRVGASGIPSNLDWQALSSGGGRRAPRDWVLMLIDRYLFEYNQRSNGWVKVSILGQLYFLTDRWLREATVRGDALTQAREPRVLGLFKAVVDNLCFLLDCKVNYLPELIELFWGRILTNHGYEIDNLNHPALGLPPNIPRGGLPTLVEYLTAAEREKYRLFFINGLAYQSTWWNRPPYDLVPADSTTSIGWTDAEGPTAPQMMERGFHGFAMNMRRDIFVAHHVAAYEKDNFFHSSYLAGGTVLCTGSVKMVRGRVLAIKNDSGHYKPTLEHMTNVVQALQMYGVAPHLLDVILVANSWRDAGGYLGNYEIMVPGNQVLRWGGEGKDVFYRKQANDRNIAARTAGS